MLKKLLIAAVAVIAGLVVLTKVTKISPMVWVRDCCHSARSMVPPEVQLKQLKEDINNIDKEIDKNLAVLAHKAAEVQNFEDQLARDGDRQAHLLADIGDMSKSLQEGRAKVAFRGSKADADDLTQRLNMANNEYVCLKEKVKTQKNILAEKNRALKTAKTRIAKMKNEQNELRLLAVQLENQLEMLRMKQVENQDAVFDESALSRAQETARDVKTRLREIENLIQYRKEFGRTEKVEPESSLNREEVLKQSDRLLHDNKTTQEVFIDKNQK